MEIFISDVSSALEPNADNTYDMKNDMIFLSYTSRMEKNNN